MFLDKILLSLARKVKLPDVEFFANLGDWPLSTYDLPKKYPILSWCGSTSSYDITMPTYEVTDSVLENMGRLVISTNLKLRLVVIFNIQCVYLSSLESSLHMGNF